MTRILHLSDIHFGAVDERLIDQVISLAQDLRPDATIVSGDLTQRARPEQFAKARVFMDRLPGPVACVPGNHDMPLYNILLRLTAPFARFRRIVDAEVEPTVTLPGAVIQGVNTADPYAWKTGRLRPASVARLDQAFAAAGLDTLRVAVLHHAPVPAADGTPADIAAPPEVLAALARAGTDVVLSGHTHMPHAGFAETAAGILFLQVGTAISTRLKTNTNDFAMIELAPTSVTRHAWLARQGGPFIAQRPLRFLKTATGWQADADP